MSSRSLVLKASPECNDLTIEGGDDDVFNVVTVDVHKRRRGQHALRLVGVDRNCLHNNKH